MKKEHYASKLIHQFVSLLVACVKSHNAQPSVSHDTTLHRQREVIQTDGSTC